jgi:hypothetical protein
VRRVRRNRFTLLSLRVNTSASFRGDPGENRTLAALEQMQLVRLGAELLRCRKCLAMKPWTEFPRRGRYSNRLHTWCKACFSAYKAERHQKNHDREMRRIRKNQAIQVAASRARVAEHLQTHPCVDCGEADPIVLEFDHVRGEKVDDVSRLVAGGFSWSRIGAEIAKCEVRGANCHRRVTSMRRREATGIAEELSFWLVGDPGAIRTRDQHLRRVLL